MSMRLLLVSGFSRFASSVEDFGIAAETAVILLILLAALLSALICLPLMFCCSRHTKSPSSPHYTRKDVICKKGLFALMLARLDEFDTLTPLLMTPGGSSSNSDSSHSQSVGAQSPQASPRSVESDSPPPPRRPQQGRTLIVPLTASRYRTPPVPLLGTPDSRVMSLEGGTTKSCATIPEDDEEGSCERIDDLVSIDRTSVSVSDHKSSRYYFSPSAYNLVMPQQPPEFQSSSSGFSGRIPVPMYSAPDVPRPQTLCTLKERNTVIHRSASDSSSIGSVHSSLGTGSPLDTTGSVSDSFYINSDVISSTNGSQVIESAAGNESDIQSKFHLHRIEEESEAGDDSAVLGRRNVTASTEIVIPRSISQQFEMMRRS